MVSPPRNLREGFAADPFTKALDSESSCCTRARLMSGIRLARNWSIQGVVVARSGFHSSINYRSVMAFGRAILVEDDDHKRRAMDTFIDRFIPGRTKANRAPKPNELKLTKLLNMEIEEASAKVRRGPPEDDDEDYALPIWAGVINFKTVVSGTTPDPRNISSVQTPPGVAAYVGDQRLDEILSAIYDGDRPHK